MKKFLVCIFTFLFISTVGFALLAPAFSFLNEKQKENRSLTIASALEKDSCTSWAETRLSQMTLEEKIAQLAIIRIHSNYDSAYDAKMVDSIAHWQPGGVCFFQGSPTHEAVLTNRIQAVSKIPMLVSIDGEWGVAMRLDSTPLFPRQMMLGALPAEADSLIYEMGIEVGEQCKLLGIHLNFAPCVDVNNNPQNPVINSRSFGENREKVARKGILYSQGMQKAGILTCAKHFPGHGDTETDSHQALPTIKKSYFQLDTLEFYPFKQIFAAQVDMVMVAHLNIPTLDSNENSISSLSPNIVTHILREEFGYKGLVITDGLEMNGVRKRFPGGGEAEIRALEAGNDLLLLPEDLAVVIPAIKAAIDSGRLTEKQIDEKCLKILKTKEKIGLTQFVPLSTENLYEKLNAKQIENTCQQIYSQALTLLKNDDNVLPLAAADTSTIALLCIGNLQDSLLLREVAAARHLRFIHLDRSKAKKTCPNLSAQIMDCKRVIVALLGTNQSPVYKYGITDDEVEMLKMLTRDKQVVLGLFGNPYGLERLGNLAPFSSVAVAYQPFAAAVPLFLSALYGESDFPGTLPVATAGYPAGHGLHLGKVVHVEPDGYSALSLAATREIDSLVKNAIHKKILPGCQILAMKNGQTLYHKNFGRLTYHHHDDEVSDTTLYDIASLTKAVATSLAVMKLYDEHKIQLTDKISQYLDYLKNTDKADLTLAELLTHTSGLPSLIPFYQDFKTHAERAEFFEHEKDAVHTVEVAEKMWLDSRYIDTLHRKIATCPLKAKAYLYSDLNFVLLKEMVEKVTGIPIDQYLTENFYKPLGLQHTCFMPLHHFPKDQIAPTEDDHYFRHQLIQGYVHDETASFFGGVSGNAGLFSTVSDVAVIAQMLLNGGTYAGRQYLTPATVKLFSSTYPLHGCQRRGLGFDTPDYAKRSGLFPAAASRYIFGHQGFTGVVFWCDPENGMIYVFLSNRVYPNREPNKLAQSNLRTNIHKIIYSEQ